MDTLFLTLILTILMGHFSAHSQVFGRPMAREYEDVSKAQVSRDLPRRLNSVEVRWRLKMNEGRVYNSETEYPPLWSSRVFEFLNIDIKIAKLNSTACQPRINTSSQIWVVENSDGETIYENLRPSENGGEVLSVLPNRSLVYLVGDYETESHKKYIEVKVLSVAPYIGDPLDIRNSPEIPKLDGKRVAHREQTAFIFTKSLQSIQNYYLDLGENRFIEHAIENGYDFSNHALIAQVDRHGYESTVVCAENENRTDWIEYKFFSLIDRDSREVVNEIGISLLDPRLLYTAVALPIEEEKLTDPIREDNERRSFLDESFRLGRSLLSHMIEDQDSEVYQKEKERTEKEESLRGEISPSAHIPGVRVYKHATSFVVCTMNDGLILRDKDQNNTGVKLKPNSSIRFLQNFNGEAEYERGNKGEHKFYQVQSLQDGQVVQGYVSSSFIKTAADCDVAREEHQKFLRSLLHSGFIDHPGLNSESCCEYPVKFPPLEATYGKLSRNPKRINTLGKRPHGTHYGSYKARGRDHGAVDLVRPKGEPVLMVTNGVIKNFNRRYAAPSRYAPDAAFSVTHEGGFEVEYGEVWPNLYNGAEMGNLLKSGLEFAKIGVNGRRAANMLHFELYSGVHLTQKGFVDSGSQFHRSTGRFKRRSDNIDPTPYLIKWFNMRWPDRRAP